MTPLKLWKTHLEIDALYLHAARQAHSRAKTAESTIKKAEDHWKSLEEKETRILAKHNGNSYAAYDDLEPIHIQMEDAHYQIGKAYAPFLKEVAVIHMLCASCLEGHINVIAKNVISGRELESFLRFSLDAKWQFLPKILQCQGFSSGHQPYQRFTRLIKHRNELIHYKGLSEQWAYGKAPEFLPKLGLTMQEAEQSIKTTQDMIEEFAKQRGSEPPYWLRDNLNDMSYFEITRTGVID